MDRSTKSTTLLSDFATKSVAEAAKLALSALVTVATHSSPAGAVVGEGAKALVESLLKTASQIEDKIDRLLEEPIRSGLRYLEQGITHPADTVEESEGRKDLLHEAHVSLTSALSLVKGSPEDHLFILALDCIALAAHGGHRTLAATAIVKGRVDLDTVRADLIKMELHSKELMDNSRDTDRFMGDPLRDKPFGHLEQRLYARRVREQAMAANEESLRARTRFEILEDLFQLAEYLNGPGTNG